MKQRCYFIAAMCGLSMFTWHNYSLFDPITNEMFTPHYWNGLLFLYYLTWDTYAMTFSKHRSLLYRTDLIIHHIFAFIITISSLNNNALQMSNYMILECISLMNYLLRNNTRLLNTYRTLCIVFIRTPLTLWFFTYYHHNYLFPYWEATRSQYHFLYLYWLYNSSILFLFYDLFILWKIYKPKRKDA
jgi:hypothetical protein